MCRTLLLTVLAGVYILATGPARGQAGALDPSFDGDGKVITSFLITDVADAVAVQADGRIVVAGRTEPYDAYDDDLALARYNADGTLDPSFGGDGLVVTDFGDDNERAYDVALQADGRIVVAGYRGWSVPGEDFLLVRYNADGTLDPSFGVDGLVVTDFAGESEEAGALALMADGRMVAAGWAIVEDNLDFAVARYNADGSLDPSFGSGGKVTTDFGGGSGYGYEDLGYDVAVQADGRIVVAGLTGACCFLADFALARYDADGSLDSSFGGDGLVVTDVSGDGADDEAYAVALQADGRIVVAGHTQPYDVYDEDFAVARYNADGSLDSSFGGDGVVNTSFATYQEGARDIAIQPDGRIIAVGYVHYSQGSEDCDFVLARYLPGSLVIVTATALNSPVPRGEGLRFRVTLSSLTHDPLSGDLTLDVTGPDGATYFRLLEDDRTLGAFATRTPEYVLPVHDDAALGTYEATVTALEGGTAPLDSATFTFEVVPARLAEAARPGTFGEVEVLDDAPSGILAARASRIGAAVLAPNPALDRAAVAFALDEPAAVRLALYDVLGREVAAVDAGMLVPGAQRVSIDLSTLPAGLYLWRLEAGRVTTGRMTLAR